MDAGRHGDPALAARAAASAGPFPDPLRAAQAKVLGSKTAIKTTNATLQMFGARGCSRDCPMERMTRDVRVFTIGGSTAAGAAQFYAARVLGWKLPQDGYMERN